MLARIAFLVCLGTAGLGYPAVGQSHGTVVGTVFDSVSVAPLEDAEVYVWNTALRTRTDAEGRFTLTGVPAGSHRVLFLHEVLLELGVSTGSAAVEVVAGSETSVDLATPSAFTIVQNTCLLEGSTDASALVGGYVGDDDSGVALPGARIHLTWLDELNSPHTVEALSDGRGWFRFCDAPTGRRLGATARFLNRRSARQELVLQPGQSEWLHLQVADLEPGTLNGTLRDVDRGWGIEDAEVQLLGTRFKGVSGRDGKFRFAGVPPGEYTLAVSHVAYGERTDPISVGSSLSVNVAITLSVEPIELDPIEVSVESIVDLDGIIAGGTLVTREDVERVRHRARDLADVLRMQYMKDVIVRRGPAGELCVGITTGQVRLFKEECSSAIFYLDNARVSSPELITNLSAQDIDRIVVYRPVEAGNLFGLGSGNGVIVVYTKSGTRRRSSTRN